MIDERAPRPDPTRDFDKMVAAREWTIGEYLDAQIDKASRRIDALRELRNSLPGSYLNRGCSTFALLLETGK